MSIKISDPTHLTISSGSLRNHQHVFTVYDSFFSESIRFKVFEDHIVFKRAGLDDRNSITPCQKKSNWCFCISKYVFDIEKGSYNFEEIEDEDERILYFK